MSGAPASTAPRPWTPRRVRAGDWTITALTDGTLRLDGGSMWGVVPKALWQRMTPAAEDNTIPLALRPFLAERGGDKVVIEGGIGGRWEEKWRAIYAIERPVALADALSACGVAREEVTAVVLSHCHFDHCGALVAEEGGELRPLFPNARHLAPAVEIEVALGSDPVRRASYRAEDVAPLLDAGLLEGFGGEDEELLPGLRAHEAGGHSDGVHVITLNEREEGETAIFWADVVPTSHHVQPPYIMAYDIDQPRSYASRSRWLARAADEGWLGLLYHDADHAFGRVRREGARYAFDPEPGETI